MSETWRCRFLDQNVNCREAGSCGLGQRPIPVWFCLLSGTGTSVTSALSSWNAGDPYRHAESATTRHRVRSGSCAGRARGRRLAPEPRGAGAGPRAVSPVRPRHQVRRGGDTQAVSLSGIPVHAQDVYVRARADSGECDRCHSGYCGVRRSRHVTH